MILEFNINYILTHDSIARILCDTLSHSDSLDFSKQFEALMHEDRSTVELRVKHHLSRFGRLGVPKDSQLANSLGVTEKQAAAFVATMSSHLETI